MSMNKTESKNINATNMYTEISVQKDGTPRYQKTNRNVDISL